MKRLISIVEGPGEVRAVPILVRRWLHLNGLEGEFTVPDRAIPANGCGRLKAADDPRKKNGVEHYVRNAVRGRPDAILVVLDADDECLMRRGKNGLGPRLLARARGIAGGIPVSVVVANREFEAWFLAEVPALREAGVISGDLSEEEIRTASANPEARAGCKSAMGRLLGEKYEPTAHQAKLARALAFSEEARDVSPSYDKLVRELDRLVREARTWRKR